jgi:hypothetical protein
MSSSTRKCVKAGRERWRRQPFCEVAVFWSVGELRLRRREVRLDDFRLKCRACSLPRPA